MEDLRRRASSADAASVVSVESAERRSQFEHLRALLPHMLERSRRLSQEPFVLFSDDDDISSTHRLKAYGTAIAVSGSPVVHLPCMATGPRVARTDGEVRALLDSCEAVVTDHDEYFLYAVRLGVLRRFLREQGAAALSHRFCDLRFVQWLHAGYEVPPPDPGWPPGEWLYYYCRPVVRSPELETDVGTSESELHVRDIDRVRASAAGTPFVTPEMAAFMRQVAEMYYMTRPDAVGPETRLAGAHLMMQKWRHPGQEAQECSATQFVLECVEACLTEYRAERLSAAEAGTRGRVERLALEIVRQVDRRE